ncbi:hypothetical protein PG984_007192 [Apiospora sp. TS-2023a]
MPSDIAKLLEDARLEWLSYDAPATDINWYWRRALRDTTEGQGLHTIYAPYWCFDHLGPDEVEKQPTVAKKRGRPKGSKKKQPLCTLAAPVAEEEGRGQLSVVDRDEQK